MSHCKAMLQVCDVEVVRDLSFIDHKLSLESEFLHGARGWLSSRTLKTDHENLPMGT